MILFVLFVVLLLIALGFLIAGIWGPAADRWIYRWWAGGVLVCSLVVIFFACYNSVGAQETAVPVTFGHTSGELSSGIHFLSPFTNLRQYPTTVQDYRMAASATNSAAADGQENDAVAFTGSDNGQMTADVDVFYLVNNATRVLHTQGSIPRLEQNLIRGNVRAALNKEANTQTSDVLLHNISSLEPKLVADLAATFTANGITLTSIQIRNPIPGPNLTAKLAAQQNIQTEQANQQAASIAAQTALIQANGQAAAARALGQAIEQFPNVTCNTFVQGLIDGKITGPVYVAPGCPSSVSGVTPLVEQPAAPAASATGK